MATGVAFDRPAAGTVFTAAGHAEGRLPGYHGSVLRADAGPAARRLREGPYSSSIGVRLPSKNTICLWCDGVALDAALFYAETFADSAVGSVHRAPGDYPPAPRAMS